VAVVSPLQAFDFLLIPLDARFRRGLKGAVMEIDLITIQPIIALAAGILILLMPRLLNSIVAIYLIVVGVTGLLA
jgi:hypothetical protein